jgi:hypothetical protein
MTKTLQTNIMHYEPLKDKVYCMNLYVHLLKQALAYGSYIVNAFYWVNKWATTKMKPIVCYASWCNINVNSTNSFRRAYFTRAFTYTFGFWIKMKLCYSIIKLYYKFEIINIYSESFTIQYNRNHFWDFAKVCQEVFFQNYCSFL